MLINLPLRRPDITDLAQAASCVEDAFLAGDPFLVVLALKEITRCSGCCSGFARINPMGDLTIVAGKLAVWRRRDRPSE